MKLKISILLIYQKNTKHYDLLILGIGNSLFAPLINSDVINLIKRSKHSIGIFGTQYRRDFPKNDLKKLISYLDFWFARYENDLNEYAVSTTNCIHLGDWLISQFNFKKPIIKNTLLTIGNEIWNTYPLDRTIQEIQLYNRVHSTRLHPLLCALMSASKVSYIEQRESSSRIVSGKFEYLFLDIFKKNYPENTFFNVNKEMVAEYRQTVLKNIEQLKITIYKILQI